MTTQLSIVRARDELELMLDRSRCLARSARLVVAHCLEGTGRAEDLPPILLAIEDAADLAEKRLRSASRPDVQPIASGILGLAGAGCRLIELELGRESPAAELTVLLSYIEDAAKAMARAAAVTADDLPVRAAA